MGSFELGQYFWCREAPRNVQSIGGRGDRQRYNKHENKTGDGEQRHGNEERPNMSYKNKGKGGQVAAANAAAQANDPKIKKQTSTVSSGSITSTNRFSAF